MSISIDQKRKILQEYDRRRIKGDSNPLNTVKQLISQGLNISLNDFSYILYDLLRSPDHRSNSQSMFNFIGHFFEDKENLRVLDTLGGLTSLSLSLSKKFPGNEYSLFMLNSEEYNLVNELSKSDDLQPRMFQWDYFMRENDVYDIVIGNLPWGRGFLEVPEEAYADPDYHTGLKWDSFLTFKALKKLDNKGTSFLIVRNNFFVSDQKRRLLDFLKPLGLRIRASLYIPKIFEHSYISGNLLVIDKGETNDLFIGELQDDIENSKVLFKNLISEKQGRFHHYGYLVNIEEYRSFNSLVLSDALEKKYSSIGLRRYNIGDISSVSIYKPSGEVNDEEGRNSIYVHHFANNMVLSRPPDSDANNGKYIRIKLDDKYAIAEFLADFLNSSAGSKFKDSWANYGSNLGRISPIGVRNGLIFLPQIDKQIEVLETNTKLRGINTELSELEQRLWDNPHNSSKILGKLKKYLGRDEFVEWLETLPFPLSSILWEYQASKDNRQKVEQLLHFFEAFSEFNAVLLLSAIYSNEDILDLIKKKAGDKITEFAESLLVPTFNSWNILNQRINKTIRDIIDGEDNSKRQQLFRALGGANDEFIKMITSKDLFQILRDASKIRNDRGHEGIHTKQEDDRHLAELSSKLTALRSIISLNYERLMLFDVVRSMDYKDGVFDYLVRELRGTRTRFIEVNKEITHPLEKGKLYYTYDGEKRAIELLPFLSFGDEPTGTESACYFFNRVDGENVKYVSYHFKEGPEKFSNNLNEIKQMLSSLFNNKN